MKTHFIITHQAQIRYNLYICKIISNKHVTLALTLMTYPMLHTSYSVKANAFINPHIVVLQYYRIYTGMSLMFNVFTEIM